MRWRTSPVADRRTRHRATLLTQVDGAVSPYEAFFYYDNRHLRAVRRGPWKLYLPWGDPEVDSNAQALPALFHLVDDVAEQLDQQGREHEIVQELMALAEEARIELGDGNIRGEGQRDAGFVENPQPLHLRE